MGTLQQAQFLKRAGLKYQPLAPETLDPSKHPAGSAEAAAAQCAYRGFQAPFLPITNSVPVVDGSFTRDSMPSFSEQIHK